jgi:hypothetical protein
VVNHAYKNEAGDDVLYFPENLAAFLPAASTDWGSLVYGSDLIPKDEGDGFKEVQGRYSYSEMQKNPAGITLYGGLRLLPVIKKAGSIVKVTVTAA